jgi:hypothetical protein
MRRRTSRAGRFAAVVGVLVTSVLVTSTPPAAAEGQQFVDVFLNYTCAFPNGPRAAGVEINGTFPARGAPGELLTPTGISINVNLPDESVADLQAIGAATVGGTTRLAVSVTEDTVIDAGWPDVPIFDTPIITGLPLGLSAFSDMPSVAMGNNGSAVFSAGALTLTLHPLRDDGTPTDPDTITAACTLDEGQDPTIATVGPPLVLPPGCAEITGGIPTCAYVNGFATVRKLGASVKVEPGLTNVAIVNPTVDGDILRSDNPAEIVGGRFPPMDGTFFGFGFVPIEAKMEMIQVGPMNIHTEGLAVPPFDFSVRAESQLDIHVISAKINGVPLLNIGPNCHTVTPVNTVLTGGTPDYTNILLGGPLSGVIDIPPFAGCGTTEDLSPLFTGTVSGPGNVVHVVQGAVCAPVDGFGTCPPVPAEITPPGAR